MLVCIPTNGNAGTSETLSDHFGSARYFTLYDSRSGEIKIVENRNTEHIHGACLPVDRLAGHNIDSIVCRGMGRRAIEMLINNGVTVYQSGKRTVEEVVEEIKNNDLQEIDPATACGGHGHHQGFIHGDGPGFDRGDS